MEKCGIITGPPIGASKLVTVKAYAAMRLRSKALRQSIHCAETRTHRHGTGRPPGLGHDVHDRARALAELRVVVTGLDAELLKRVGEWERPVDVGHLVHIVAAIQKIVRLIGKGSVRAGHDRRREGLSIALVDSIAFVGCIHYAGNQRLQRRCVSAVQRQVHYAFLVDDLRQSARRRIHLRNCAGHLDRLSGRADG